MASELWEKLRAARGAAGVKQQEIAEACGVTRVAVGHWESKDERRRTHPPLEKLKVFAELTNTTISWLTDDDADASPNWLTASRANQGAINVGLYNPSSALHAVARARGEGRLVEAFAANEDTDQTFKPERVVIMPDMLSGQSYRDMDLFAFIMPDHSMGNLVQRGDMVFIDATVARPAPGDLVVVNAVDNPGIATVRKFTLHQTNGDIDIHLEPVQDQFPVTVVPGGDAAELSPASGEAFVYETGSFCGRVVAIMQNIESGEAIT